MSIGKDKMTPLASWTLVLGALLVLLWLQEINLYRIKLWALVIMFWVFSTVFIYTLRLIMWILVIRLNWKRKHATIT